MKGFEGAAAAGADEIVIFSAASEAFAQKNINCSIAESIERFVPVAKVSDSTTILIVHPNFPANNIRELVSYANANPGKLSFGSAGVGSGGHLATELFLHTAGVKAVHIPYKGSAPALVDMLGGRVAAMFDTVPGALPHVKSGKVKIAIDQRYPLAQAAQAHRDLESRKTTGCTILTL